MFTFAISSSDELVFIFTIEFTGKTNNTATHTHTQREQQNNLIQFTDIFHR